MSNFVLFVLVPFNRNRQLITKHLKRIHLFLQQSNVSVLFYKQLTVDLRPRVLAPAGNSESENVFRREIRYAGRMDEVLYLKKCLFNTLLVFRFVLLVVLHTVGTY